MNLAGMSPLDIRASYNVAPTQFAPIVRLNENGERIASMLRWGLIPSWSKDESIGSRCINARSEDAATKLAYRGAAKSRRCLVPLSSFYEWQTIDGQEQKQPWSIRVRDVPLFAVAGLWERWEQGLEPIETFAMLTRSPNSLIARIHDRMPVIVRPEHYDAWLDPKNENYASLENVVEAFPAEQMEMHRVSTRVNSVRNDDAALLSEVQQTKEAPTLFS